MSKSKDEFPPEEAARRLVAALRGARIAGHVPMKAKEQSAPPLEKFKSLRIPGSLPGPKRGPKPKGERALTGAERSAKSRLETRDTKAPKKTKKKPSK